MNWMIPTGIAGIAYLFYNRNKAAETGFQSMNTLGADGTPIQVATPVSDLITFSQATGTSSQTPITYPSISQPRYTPVPTTIPGHGVYYAPPGTITAAERGGIFQPAPIVITQHGAASIAVGSVKNVQHSLNALGCKPPLVEDGKLGPKTIACIQAFQKKNGLVVDGNAGGSTKAALSAALTHTAGGASVIGTMIKASKPETGKVVHPTTGAVISTQPALTMGAKDVQHALNMQGASPPLSEDGKMGPKTVAAIKSFQTAHGLTPDGVAGPKTKSALYLAGAASSVAKTVTSAVSQMSMAPTQFYHA